MIRVVKKCIIIYKNYYYYFKLSTRKKTKKEGAVKQQNVPPPVKPELVVDPNEKRHPAMTVAFAFSVRPTTIDHPFKQQYFQ